VTRQNGFAIRDFRRLRAVSISEMAFTLDITPAHYRKLEAETREAQPVHLERMARRFDVSVASLVRTPPGSVAGSVSAGRETVRA
jgi:transcriptional regulator with XRE-family HTH domain